ncbi:MAG TPA: CRISPR-associated endonuclease Cas2 [Candidatus Paceibacterota bacterium]
MGNLEDDYRKRRRKHNIQSAILNTLLIGTVVLVAGPLFLKLLIKSAFDPRRKVKKYTINRALTSLLDRGYVYFNNTDWGKKLEITNKGRAYLLAISDSSLLIPKPKKWDRKFRMVIFDIRESKRADRDKFRLFLRRLGFMRLQDSVWVYPYDCEDIITLIKSEFKIGRGILYLIVDTIEYDKPIREFFLLPQS